MKKTERLFLNSWNYNSARILSALAVIIENNGGQIIRGKYDNDYLVSNRSILEKIERDAERIELVEKHGKNADTLKADLEQYKAAHADEAEKPILCTHKSYIKFALDGNYYYYSTDDNPFFDFYYTKAPIIGGTQYDANRYCSKAKKDWLIDRFLFAGCPEADIKEAANLIYNELLQAPHGRLINDRHRVPNTYNNSYHYETTHTQHIKALNEI